jgi:hypothetical protein
MPLDDSKWDTTVVVAESENATAQQPCQHYIERQGLRESIWRRIARSLKKAWTPVRVVLPEPPQAAPVDARVRLLAAAYRETKKRDRMTVVDFIRSQHTASPAAINGALEAIRAVSGHPVNADLRFSRYSCDTRCMSRAKVQRYLREAVEHIQRDPTRFVAS